MKKLQLALAGLILLMTGYGVALTAGSMPVSFILSVLAGSGRTQYGLEIESDHTKLIAAAIGILALASVGLALWVRGGGNRRGGGPVALAEERTAEIYKAGERRAYPKTILQNPFGPELEYLTFEQKIDVAIEGTLQASRYVGVIFIPIFSERRDTDEAPADGVAKPLAIAREMIAAEIKANMRKHDGLNVEAGGITIAITLMKSFGNLDSVSRRLQIVASLAARRHGAISVGEAGSAAYPLDGYSAAELLQTARGRAASAQTLDAWEGEQIAASVAA